MTASTALRRSVIKHTLLGLVPVQATDDTSRGSGGQEPGQSSKGVTDHGSDLRVLPQSVQSLIQVRDRRGCLTLFESPLYGTPSPPNLLPPLRTFTSST